MANPLSGVMSSLGKKAGTFTDKPFKWIDGAKTEQQRRIRLAVVCSGMVLLGLLVLTISLATTGVIGSGGFNPGNFSLDFSSAPLFLIGTGLIGAGIGFAISQSLRHSNPKQAKMINAALGVVGWVCFTGAVAALLFTTFKGGLVQAMTTSTQVIVAPLALIIWGAATYQLCQHWKPSELALNPAGAIYGKLHETSRVAIEDIGRKEREARAERINGGRKLGAALRRASA